MPVNPVTGVSFVDFFDEPEDTIKYYHSVLDKLEKNSDNFLVRMKPLPPQPFYSKFIDTNYSNRISQYLVENEGPSGQTVAESSLVIGDFITSTIFIQCIYANHPILLLVKKWPWFINDEANEVFLKLKDAGVVQLIKDCNDKDLSSIFNDPDDWWSQKIVVNAIDYYRSIYLPELPNEFHQWLNAIKTIKKYHATS